MNEAEEDAENSRISVPENLLESDVTEEEQRRMYARGQGTPLAIHKPAIKI